MSSTKILNNNPDIYDGLADNFNIDLLNYSHVGQLINRIDFDIAYYNQKLFYADNDETTEMVALNKHTANLAMLKALITL